MNVYQMHIASNLIVCISMALRLLLGAKPSLPARLWVLLENKRESCVGLLLSLRSQTTFALVKATSSTDLIRDKIEQRIDGA